MDERSVTGKPDNQTLQTDEQFAAELDDLYALADVHLAALQFVSRTDWLIAAAVWDASEGECFLRPGRTVEEQVRAEQVIRRSKTWRGV